MTEEQAKTKWCPMARLGEEGSTYNTWYVKGEPTGRTLCIASDCMMFRARTNRDMGYDRNLDEIHDYFCGLAGMRGAL